MAKAIYGKYSCNAKTKYLTPTQQNIRKTWNIYPKDSGEKSTTILYFRSYAFSEDSGFIGTSETGHEMNLNDGSGTWDRPKIESGYMQITPTEAPYICVYDRAGNYAEVISVFQMVSEKTTVYSRGSYLSDVIADYDSLPADGRHSDGYWYTFIKMASDLKVNVGGIWRDAPTGYTNIEGIWRSQSELKTNVNGIWK